MKPSFLFILCLFFSFSCASDQQTEKKSTAKTQKANLNYEQVSVEICNCVSPLAELNKEIEFLVKTERKEKALAMLKEVQEKQELLEDCIDNLESKYKSEDLVESEKMFAYLKKKCPETAEYLSGN